MSSKIQISKLLAALAVSPCDAAAAAATAALRHKCMSVTRVRLKTIARPERC